MSLDHDISHDNEIKSDQKFSTSKYNWKHADHKKKKKEVRKDRKNKEMWMICQMVDNQMYYAGGAKRDLLSCKESQIIHEIYKTIVGGGGWMLERWKSHYNTLWVA